MSLYLGTTPVANTGYNKANTDLSNLASTGKNIANWSNNVTNCITEIPQDIKLELNNGTLTLKAGSKVYVPNGFEADGTTPKFDVINITSDISTNYAGYPDYDNIFICLKTDGSFATYFKAGNQNSGSSGVAYSFTYRTDLNKIYDYEESTTNPYEQVSFPIGRFKYQNNSIAMVYQVFNGFGYIGSTVFALPGVKGLIPNGRNADGSLKNIEWVASQVITSTLTFGAQSYYFGVYNNNQKLGFYGKIVTKYDEENNTIIDTYPDPDVITTGWSFFGECIADSNNKITSLTSKTAFHALDYNDSSTISGWSMPSSKYIDLTLGASGSTYTAPANGWVYLNKNGNPNQFLNLINVTKDYAVNDITSASAFGLLIMMPINRGDVFRIDYNLDGATNHFRFIYANGSESEAN